MISWNENAVYMHTFDVSIMIVRTSYRTNSWVAGELRCHFSCICLINICRPRCMWNHDEIFYWLFTRVQLLYLPTRIVINTLSLCVRLTKSQHWFTYDGLTPTGWKAIARTNGDPIEWHICMHHSASMDVLTWSDQSYSICKNIHTVHTHFRFLSWCCTLMFVKS